VNWYVAVMDGELLAGTAFTNVTVTGDTPAGVVTVTALLLPLTDVYLMAVSSV
jgi:hypothetical protein